MFNSSMPFTMNVEPAGYSSNNSGNGMWGGDGWWFIIVLALLFGWGNNGFGGFGGGNGTLAATETQATLQRGFDSQNVISKLDGLTQGLCDSTYALNNTLMNGFHGVDNAVCNLGYQTQSGFNALGSQLASCCCGIERSIDGVNYNLATQSCDTRNTIQNTTRDIIDNQNCNTRQILDFLVNDKISTLTAENQSLKFAASQSAQNAYLVANQEAQTAELIRRIAPYPVPAYSVPAPFAYGYGYGCGCNSGCGCA